MRVFTTRATRAALTAGLVALLPVGSVGVPAQGSPRPTAAPAAGHAAADVQRCAIAASRVSRTGPVRGLVRTRDCAGWTLWYGMQVQTRRGWTRIAGRGAFAGAAGARVYRVRACQPGTFTYRMFAGRRGGLPPTLSLRVSRPVRRTC